MLTDVPTSSEKKVAQTVSEIVSKRKKRFGDTDWQGGDKLE